MKPSMIGVFAVLGVLATTGTAQASCVDPPPMPDAIETSAATFVGTVVGLENDRRWATVEVVETWKGEDVPIEVEVRAGPKDPPGPTTTATSVDRMYTLGETYLFVVYQGRDSVFRDNICSRTTPYDPRFERFRPSNLVSPSPSPSGTSPAVDRSGDLSDNPVSAIAVASMIVVTAAALGAVAWLVRRR